MRQRDRESTTDSDHGLFFGPSDDDSLLSEHLNAQDRPMPRVQRVSRSEMRAERGHRAARRRSRRVLVIMGVLLVAVVAAATWLVVLPIYHYLSPSDYSGRGTGTVLVEVKANDGASAIGTTLHDKGVVASVRAFTDAAKNDSRSQNIQPGSYKLRSHMSAKNALGLLLDPSSRVNSDVVITEGATTLDVARRLVAAPCASNANKSAICGPGLTGSAVTAALKNVKAIGLPTDFTVAGKTPTSVEGFLYPATYFFPENTSPAVALQAMVTKFTSQARSTNFTAQAKALRITPYQELVIASMVQSEAKFPADAAKVARVILNRFALKKALKIDASTRYGALITGVDPNKIKYDTYPTPYNTYLHIGLPPTPISNPGAEAMNAAAHPAAGTWTFYVNGDKAGHLFFTNSEVAFVKAQQKCHDQGWGCAAP